MHCAKDIWLLLHHVAQSLEITNNERLYCILETTAFYRVGFNDVTAPIGP